MVFQLHRKKLKALGLIEILASIAIFGGVIIVLTALTLTAYRTVKNDELVDSATGFMVNALEYFKSPQADVYLNNASTQPVGTVRYYYFKDGAVNTSATQELSTTNCSATAGSQFRVNLQVPLTSVVSGPTPTPNSLAAFIVCNEVAVTKAADGSFILRSILVYKVESTFTKTELNGYRPPIVN